MTMKHLFCAAFALAAMTVSAKDNYDYVDPFIGTTNYSVCNPGAVMPHGLMSVVPFNVMGSDLNRYDKDKQWWSAPYEYTNKFFTGFAHVTLSGVGCPEMGSVLVMPTTGAVEADCSKYGSEYEAEKASPGYYSVRLKKYGIGCEVTSTMRSSCERFTFPAGQGNVLVNLGDALSNESGAWVRRVSDTEIEGMRNLGTFCYNSNATFPLYFVMRVSRKPAKTGFWKKQPSLGKVKDAKLVDAFELFQKLHSNIKAKLLFIGRFDTRDGISEEKKQQIESNSDIVISGHIDKVEIPYYYSMLDVFVFPSHREGFGMCVVEASAMEKPILDSRAHGCVDAIVEHETGEYIDLSADGICKGMELMLDEELREKLGKSGRKRVLEWYDFQVMWPLVSDLYKKTLR